MCLTDKEVPRKIEGVHNVDTTASIVAQMEVLTRKLDSLIQCEHHTLSPKPIYEGYRGKSYYRKMIFSLTHIIQLEEVSYAQNFQRQQNNLTPTHII